ncbi:MAG: hypothetical protein KC609_21880 [Myxococcales bacterium]|nr:hypothetical protein [Myxococcales bacterium]
MSKIVVVLLGMIAIGCSATRTRIDPPPRVAHVPTHAPTRHQPPPCPTGFSAVQWPPDALHLRWGSSVHRFADLQTTRQRPVEVCGVRAEYAFLRRLECPNGPLAFRRSGSIGRGGRCGKIIDLYLVTCGSQTKHVHIDMYHCPRGQSPFGF